MIFYPSVIAKADDSSFDKFISSYFSLLKSKPSKLQINKGEEAESKVWDLLGEKVESQISISYKVGDHEIRGRIDFMDQKYLYEVKHIEFYNVKVIEYAQKQLTLYHHLLSDRKLIVVLVNKETVEMIPVEPLEHWKEKIFNYILKYKPYW